MTIFNVFLFCTKLVKIITKKKKVYYLILPCNFLKFFVKEEKKLSANDKLNSNTFLVVSTTKSTKKKKIGKNLLYFSEN